MTDEALSALFDGQCAPGEVDRLLAQIERDPALKARFGRLSLAREALRGTRFRNTHLDLADRVMAELDQAPAATVIPFKPRRTWVAAWRPMAGLAAAAGLAAVAVLVMRPAADVPDAAQTAAAPVQSDRHWTELDAENARRLNNYLATHSLSRAQQGVGGTLSHARYATHLQPDAQAPAEEGR